jgi:oligopeptidase B
MSRPTFHGLAVVALSLGGCAASAPTVTPSPTSALAPPVAARRPRPMTIHGDTRVDDYYWLRDDTRRDPDMLAFLAGENAYADSVLAHTQPLQEKLYAELVGRVQQDDSTVPYEKNGFWYYTRYESGKEYPIVARRQGSLEAAEEILLDANQLAEGHAFFRLGATEPSRSGRYVAYTEDVVARNQYTLRVKDTQTGQTLPDAIPNVQPDIAWANDERTLFYVEKDPVTLLGVRVKRHVLGDDPAKDALVYEEPDHSFYISVGKTKSDRYLNIHLESTVSTEERFARADEPEAPFRVFLPRERDHEYSAEDHGDRFIVRTNWQATNFRLVEVPADRTADRSAWTDLVPHRDDTFIERFEVFRDYVAVAERSGGLRRLRVKPLAGGEEFHLASDEPAYVMRFGANARQDTDEMVYVYSSLTTPPSTYAYDMRTRERRLLKRQPVPGGFDPARYETQRLWAPARDGVRVPVTLLMLKGQPHDGTAPLLQYGYGSYGSSTDPGFNANVFSLVDRGVVYAIAHVRGGQEMGRTWYDDGHLLKKRNTFNDFIDVSEYLIANRYAAKDKLFAEGGSAGGLLMGAVVTMRPDLYRGVLAHVPFVDVITTMLDETIPLTSNEFDEWGNPKDKAFYDYMLSYSPYDQVKPQAYPNLLVTTGLWDSQVQYYEPAKWVAKLQRMKTGPQVVLLVTNMQAGHGGKSGRFERLRERSRDYAFVLDLAGIGN